MPVVLTGVDSKRTPNTIYVESPVFPHGASSKKKPFSLGAILFKIPMAIHARSSPVLTPPKRLQLRRPGAVIRRTGERGIPASLRKDNKEEAQ
jgi:hypothetical protein